MHSHLRVARPADEIVRFYRDGLGSRYSARGIRVARGPRRIRRHNTWYAQRLHVLIEDRDLREVGAAEVTHLAAVRAHFLDHLTETEITTLARVWERLLSRKSPDAECER